MYLKPALLSSLKYADDSEKHGNAKQGKSNDSHNPNRKVR
jgi:hypothetical protein